jgi:hypothetical protein
LNFENLGKRSLLNHRFLHLQQSPQFLVSNQNEFYESAPLILGKDNLRGDDNMEMLKQALLFFEGAQVGLLIIVPLLIYWLVKRVRRKNKGKTGYLEE